MSGGSVNRRPGRGVMIPTMRGGAVLVAMLLAGSFVQPADASERDPAMRKSFQKSHPCPANGRTSGPCRGYVVDHIKPLCAGGRDHPSNMQWQTVAEAKKKDKQECRAKKRST